MHSLIRSTPTCVTQVFLVVEPKFEWHAGAVKRRERAVKRGKIAAAELFRTSPLDDSPAGSTDGESTVTFSLKGSIAL